MAVVLELPIVFVIENNGYGEATGRDYAVGTTSIAQRSASFGMPATTVDGTDFFAVYDATSEAVQRARSGGGPRRSRPSRTDSTVTSRATPSCTGRPSRSPNCVPPTTHCRSSAHPSRRP